MTRYAEGTSVPIAQSRADIERILERYGATGFMYGQHGDQAAIAFEMASRHYRMELNYPTLESFLYTKGHARRSSASQKQAYEQEKRRLWRGLAMLVKAKLEAVASGITTLEEEMLSHTIMPDDQTVWQWMEPQLEHIYQSGQMPPILPWMKQKQIEAPYLDGELIGKDT